MILDSQTFLSSSQAITASANSTNTVDLSQARNIASGSAGDDAISIYITVEVAAAAAGAATVQFAVVGSAAPNLSSPVILSQTDAIPKASLTAGTQLFVPVARYFTIPNGLGLRYMGLSYVVGTGPLTAGTFSAGIVINAADSKQIYPLNVPSPSGVPTGYSVK